MSDHRSRLPLVAIVGATGTGKSDLAISLAQHFNGEIINSDALQLYKGLPIATNKVPEHARGKVPHHLLDVIDLHDKPWTVNEFCEEAGKTIDAIRERARLPILIGGSHYYLQSLLFPGLRLDENVEKFSVSVEYPNILEASTEEMYTELARVDAKMAARWHPSDRRKIRRSLEIWLQTGQMPSKLYEAQKSQIDAAMTRPQDDSQRILILWVFRRPEELPEILDKRIDDMLANGLLAEAQEMYDLVKEGEDHLLQAGLLTAIGYKEFLPFLKSGSSSEDLKVQAIERMKIATRQYSTRQLKWLRSKILRQVQQQSTRDTIMYILDRSRGKNVQQQANDLVSKFLQDSKMPDPACVCPAAVDLLAAKTQAPRFAQKCDVCDRTLMTEVEWNAHIHSKGHKRMTSVSMRAQRGQRVAETPNRRAG